MLLDDVSKVDIGQFTWHVPKYKYNSVIQVRQKVVFLHVGQSEVHN